MLLKLKEKRNFEIKGSYYIIWEKVARGEVQEVSQIFDLTRFNCCIMLRSYPHFY